MTFSDIMSQLKVNKQKTSMQVNADIPPEIIDLRQSNEDNLWSVDNAGKEEIVESSKDPLEILKKEISSGSLLDIYRKILKEWQELREISQSIDDDMLMLLKDSKEIDFSKEDIDFDKEKDRDITRNSIFENKKHKYDDIQNSIKDIKQKISDLQNYTPMINTQKLEESLKPIIEDLNFIRPTVDYIKRQNLGLSNIGVKNTTEYFRSMIVNFRKLTFSDMICDEIKRDCRAYKAFLRKNKQKPSIKSLYTKVIEIPKGIPVSNNIKLFAYIIGIVGVSLAFINLYFLLLVPIVWGVRQSSLVKASNKFFEEMLNNLSKIVSTYNTMFDKISFAKENYIEEKKAKIEHNIAKEIERLNKEASDLEETYNMNIINIYISDDEIEQQIGDDYNKRYLSLEEEKQKVLNSIENLKIKKRECLDNNEIVLNKIQYCKKCIQDKYWSLSEAGTSIYLITEYVIGFQNDNVITLDTENNMLSIIYNGETSEKNSILINMLIGQMFGYMKPSQLYLTIIDTQFSCRDYAFYSIKDLNPIINLVSRNEDIPKILESYYNEYLERQKTIKPVADNINLYNRIMVDTDSVPYNYTILLFQDISVKLLADSLFLQICRGGPELGVIPILFINREALMESKTKNIEQVKGFLQTTRNVTWKFNQTSLDLEKAKEDEL